MQLPMSPSNLMRLWYLTVIKTVVIRVRLFSLNCLNNVTIGAGMVEACVELDLRTVHQ